MSKLDRFFEEVLRAEREEKAAREEYEQLIEWPTNTPETRQAHEEAYGRLIDANVRLDRAQAEYDEVKAEEDERAFNDRRP